MNIIEADRIKIGDFVRISNPRKEKKSSNDKCVWVVIGIEDTIRSRSPIMRFDLKLVTGSYVNWSRSNKVMKEGSIITLSNRSLKKVKIISIETEDVDEKDKDNQRRMLDKNIAEYEATLEELKIQRESI